MLYPQILLVILSCSLFLKVGMKAVEQASSCVESPSVASRHGGYVT